MVRTVRAMLGALLIGCVVLVPVGSAQNQPQTPPPKSCIKYSNSLGVPSVSIDCDNPNPTPNAPQNPNGDSNSGNDSGNGGNSGAPATRGSSGGGDSSTSDDNLMSQANRQADAQAAANSQAAAAAQSTLNANAMAEAAAANPGMGSGGGGGGAWNGPGCSTAAQNPPSQCRAASGAGSCELARSLISCATTAMRSCGSCAACTQYFQTVIQSNRSATGACN
jgi:hypothetical protein